MKGALSKVELEFWRDKLFFKVATECLCFQFFVNFNFSNLFTICLQFQFSHFFTIFSSFCSDRCFHWKHQTWKTQLLVGYQNGVLLICIFGTSVSASFESRSFSFSPATSISASTCECVRNKERRRDENPPGWNECSCVAPPPPCVQSVPREGNPWMGLSQNFGALSHLLSVSSGRRANIPCLVVLHLLKVKWRSCFQI